MDMFLGINYCRGYQENFQRALKRKDFEKAAGVLERMPHASLDNRVDEMKRNAVLAIGYKVLTEHLLKGLGEMGSQLKEYIELGPSPSNLRGCLEELSKYECLGHKPEELSAKLKEHFEEEAQLKEYRSINPDLADLKENLKKLSQYENLDSNPEELKTNLDKLAELERSSDSLSGIPSL